MLIDHKQSDTTIALHIHDRVVQPLYAVTLALGADRPLTAAVQRRCQDELIGALAELRAVLREIPDAARSLPAELQRLRADGVPLELAPVPELPPRLEPLVCAVVVEAARNAVRHGDPQAVRVRIAASGPRLSVEVLSDGAPRAAALDVGPGSGLRLAAQAAREHGGRLLWGPAGEAGWRVRLTVPLP